MWVRTERRLKTLRSKRPQLVVPGPTQKEAWLQTTPMLDQYKGYVIRTERVETQWKCTILSNDMKKVHHWWKETKSLSREELLVLARSAIDSLEAQDG